MEHEDRYLDLKRLSQYCCLSVRTLREYLADPENPLPFFCVKRKILVRQSEFDKWIEQHRADQRKATRIADEVLKEFRSIGHG